MDDSKCDVAYTVASSYFTLTEEHESEKHKHIRKHWYKGTLICSQLKDDIKENFGIQSKIAYTSKEYELKQFIHIAWILSSEVEKPMK